MRRREFIQISTALAGLPLVAGACKPMPGVEGRIVGAAASVGHILRDGNFDDPVDYADAEVVIVGGGVSGLSAARWLSKHGMKDLYILDLEDHVGGNASCGSNAVSGYPWGAHYVPIPNNTLTEYLSFLEESGVITGRNEKGLPVYDEYMLCFDPQERLYINGRWQDGLVPGAGLPAGDQEEIARFMREMEGFRRAKGKDGLDAFAIPVDRSTKDAVYVALDSMTMREWMARNGYHSHWLQWYVNYCMRDDFGTTYEGISAWTGIHYYASRKGEGANAQRYDTLTWPEGNGWLVRQLCKDINDYIRPNSLVVKCIPGKDRTEVHYYDTRSRRVKGLRARHVIFSVPQFVVNRLLPVSDERQAAVKELMHYTPWMVANLTVRTLEERGGAPMSWDNVLYESESLGYVEATHQHIQQVKEKKVLTYYWPLTGGDPAAERMKAMQRTHREWVGLIFDDLRKVHPNIEEQTELVDIMLWGHAMAQPRPGWIHGGQRQKLQSSFNERIHFAHTDLAGISIFEEGFYQGIGAANKIIEAVNKFPGRHDR